MDRIQLDLRLQAVANLVPENIRLADIGTDHGYLLIELVKQGKITGGIGCDLRSGPLQFAQNHVRRSGLSSQIELRLGDGLEPIKAGEVDGVTICGMGGGTIQGILQRRPDVLEKLSYLICQPQNDGGALRKYLAESGWKIIKEELTESHGRIYESFLGVPGEMAEPEKEILWEVGPLLWQEKHPLLGKKIGEMIFLAQGALKGLEKAANTEENNKKRELWEDRLKELEEMKAWL